jgi:nicotinamidase-related amidase
MDKGATRKTALLVIDAQAGIIQGPFDGPVYQAEQLLHTIRGLLDHARSHKLPVFFVQDVDLLQGGDEAFAIPPEIAPLPGEPVIHKQATDSFHGTTLHEQLQAQEINHLVIAGCKTQFCIDSACRKATTLGYDVTLVKDGHSTTDSKVLTAEQIIAHHNSCLHGLSNLEPFILVRASSESVFEPIHDTYR